MDDDLSLSHTRWNCKYHIVFIPKYRRKEIYGKLRSDIGQIIRQLCSYKGVEIIEAHAMPDHIHMLVRIPPKIAVSNFMGYLKGKSSLMIFERHANLKYKYGNRNFWAKGFFVSTVGLDTKKVQEYIRDQEKEGSLVGKMAGEGTTPRQLTDLIGSLCDLTSGSGDKGTPVVLVQGYFTNYSQE